MKSLIPKNWALLRLLLASWLIAPHAGLHAVCTPPPAGLVAWWPGEGNALDIAGANNGTLLNGVTFAPGVVGQGFRFDGTNSFMQVPDAPALKPTSVTVEAWVWLDPNTPSAGSEVVVFKRNSWTFLFEGYTLVKDHADNGNGTFSDRFAFVVTRNGNQVILRSTTIVQRGVWYHVAGTYDGNQTTINVNGVAEGSLVAGFPLDYGTLPVCIGASGEAPPYQGLLAGIIDEPSIYNRALSSNEIAAIYNAGATGKCSANSVTNTTPTNVVPVIASFAPTVGVSGSLVTLVGTNFSATATSNIVYFGAVRATVLAASTSSLTVTVPAGATHAPLTVTVGGLMAYSSAAFEPTFFGTGSAISAATFAPGTNINAASPITTVIADLDGDGKPDLVVDDVYANAISIFQNIGSNGMLNASSFAAPVTFFVGSGGDNPLGLTIADVDGDGRLDLLVPDRNGNQIAIFHNVSTGGILTTNSFAAPVFFPTGVDPRRVAVADLDGDGRSEIISANGSGGSVSILRNIGSAGSLTTNSFAAHLDLPAVSPENVAIGDLDGDGKPDLAVSDNTGLISLYRNHCTVGNISLATFDPRVDLAAQSYTMNLVLGDLDGDGKLELIATAYLPQTMSVYRNQATPGSLTTNSFAAPVTYALAGRGHTLALGDLNGDGKTDIAEATELGDALSVFQNVSSGSFTNTSLAARVDFATGWNAWGVAVGDLDGDGRPDAVLGNVYDNTLTLYKNLTPFGTNTPPPSCTPAPSGVVGWWRGEGNAADASGGNNGMLQNGAGIAAGEVGQGFQLNGAGGLVKIPKSASLDVGNQVTVEFWMKANPSNAMNSYQGLVTSDFYGIGIANGFAAGPLGVNFHISTDGGASVSPSSYPDTATPNGGGAVVSVGQWHHVAGTYDGTKLQLYIDGQPWGVPNYHTGQISPMLANSFLSIGAEDGRTICSDCVSNRYFNGLIDEASIYNRALSASEILAIYQAGSAGKCNSSPTLYSSALVLDLPLDGSAVDIGPNHLTVITNGGGLFVTNRFLQASSALALDGVGQNLSIPFDARLNPTEFTIGVWAQFQSFQGTLWRSGDASADAWRGFGLAVDGGVLNYIDANGSGYNAIVYASSNLVAGIWYHLVVTRTTNTCVVYVNGLPTGSQTGLTPYAKAQVTPLSFGSNLGFPGDSAQFAQFCPVTLDNIHLYNRALSSNEVSLLYQFEMPATPTLLAPFITQQPTNLTVTVSNAAFFTVTAQGALPLFYQWRFNGTNISGATNTTLTLDNISPSLAGNYSVLVSNFVGTATSSNAQLTVYVPPTPPILLAQTPSQVVLLGSSAIFSVTVGGSDPLSYFWSRNNVLINGATNAFFVLTNAQLADSGSKFSCLVTNAYGTVTSTNVSLKVIDTLANDLCSGAILITNSSYTNAQSTARASSFGDPQPGCVTAFGNGVWYQFTAPVSGRLVVDTFGSDYDTGLAIYIGACGELSEVACNDDSGGQNSLVTIPTAAGVTYSILVGGYGAHVGNLVLHLNHFTPPAFDLQPANLAVVVSSNATFATTVSGTQPIALQWFFNNAPLTDGGRISGSTNATLNLANVITNDGGNYYLVASNWVGVTTSSVAVLTLVILPPVFVQMPSSQALLVGSNVTFTASITGTLPFTYQWLFNGSPTTDDGVKIFGSGTGSLTISNLTTADAGNYSVQASNPAGVTNSTAAVLTVLVPPTILTQPVGRSVPVGLPTTFLAGASGIPTPTIQWQLNGTIIPGANSSTYTVTAVGTNALGFYTFTASNAVGLATSSAAQLTLGPVAAWGRNLNNESLPPPGLSNVVAISGTYGAGFAVRADGSVIPWGGSASQPNVTNIPAAATNVVAIATSGTGASAALRADGRVVGWNIQIPALSNCVAVAMGNNFGVALRAEGTVAGWGVTAYSTPPATLNNDKAIACGNTHTLALKNDGTVVTWGSGTGTNVPAGLSGIIAIAAGSTHSLALRTNGTVIAWGSGAATNLPTAAAGLTNIIALSASSYTDNQSLCLALRADGVVIGWGTITYGENIPPSALRSLFSVSAVAAPLHGLALVNDGTPQFIQPPVGLTAYSARDVSLSARAVGAAPLVYQWLLNGVAISGATNANLLLPNIQPAAAGNYQLLVTNLLGSVLSLPTAVNVSSNNTLVFLSQTTNSLTNYQGATITTGSFTVLGNGPLRYQWFSSPTNSNYLAVAGATNETLTLNPALASQSGNYYVAVSNLFAGITSSPVNIRVQFAKAWGFGAVTNPPVNVTNAIALATGGATGNLNTHYFALGADGKLTSWANYFPSYGETNVAALSNSLVTAIAASYQHSLALKSDGTVYAWGYGGYGQTNPPANLSGGTAIACGGYHDLVLKNDGTVVGWGATLQSPNYGQATNNPAATNVIAIAAGNVHSLALRADGTVVAWGNPADGSTTIPNTATNLIAVAAGNGISAGLRNNGTVVQWGNSISGYPVPANLSNVVAISAAGTHVSALKNDGSVVSWGYLYISPASNSVPADVANVSALTSSGDHDFALFGTRAPSFTVQPWNRTVSSTTTSVWFVGKCAGVQPMRYQWRLNGTNLPAATNDLLTVAGDRLITGPFGPVSPGVYQLIASNSYGVVSSKPVKLTVVYPLSDALDTPTDSRQISLYNWITTGSAPWFGQTNISHDGVDAARSGGIGAAQETILQTTVATNIAGRYKFWWKVSSEAFFDTLEFRINGIPQMSISGEVDWQAVNVPVAAGTNILQWRYSKDISYDAGLDAGWVDQFAFLPNPPIILVQPQPAGQTVNLGATISLGVTASGTPPLRYLWSQNGNLVGGNSPTLVLNNVARAQAGTYSVTITNAGGLVSSSNAIVRVNVPQLLGAPTLLPDGSLQLSSTDANGGLLTLANLANFEAQASTNLVDWTTLPDALSLTNGLLQLQDATRTNFNTRYYRILEH